jgi:hypothetical protein
MKSGFDAADRFLAGATVESVTRPLRDVLTAFYGMLQRDGELAPEHAYTCLLCKRTFATDHGLGIHIGKAHRKPVTLPATGPADSSASTADRPS